MKKVTVIAVLAAMMLLPIGRALADDFTHPKRCKHNDERYMMGQHSKNNSWFPSGCGKITTPNSVNKDIGVNGTDMGMSLYFEESDLTLFFMGDTWGSGADAEDCSDGGFTCTPGAVRTDAMGVMIDNYPYDGIDVWAMQNPYVQDDLFLGLPIMGIHDKWAVEGTALDQFWHGHEWPFTTVTGVTAVPFSDGEYMILLWYATGGAPMYPINTKKGRCNLRNQTHCNSNYLDGYTPQSFMVSQRVSAETTIDEFGYGFTAYSSKYDPKEFEPFSRANFGWSDCMKQQADPGTTDYQSAHFIAVKPNFVSHDDLVDMCGSTGYDKKSPMCKARFVNDKVGGILLYGKGRPVNRTPMYLAYMTVKDVLSRRSDKPKVFYFNGYVGNNPNHSWSTSESDAAPLPLNFWQGRDLPCDELDEAVMVNKCDSTDFDYPPEMCLVHKNCWYANANFGNKRLQCKWNDKEEDANEKNLFGIASIKIIKDHVSQPAVLMFYNWLEEEHSVNHVYNGDQFKPAKTFYRTARLSRPWELSEPVEVKDSKGRSLKGYAPLIIEKFTKYNEGTNKLDVWHTMSTWDMAQVLGRTPNNAFPYGVYTRKSSIDWPPW